MRDCGRTRPERTIRSITSCARRWRSGHGNFTSPTEPVEKSVGGAEKAFVMLWTQRIARFLGDKNKSLFLRKFFKRTTRLRRAKIPKFVATPLPYSVKFRDFRAAQARNAFKELLQ